MSWESLEISESNFTGVLNSNFCDLENKYQGVFTNLRPARTLLSASDYIGEAKDRYFTVFSFLLTSLDSWQKWEPKRIQVRQAHLSNSRRMSFKRLGDKQRRAALVPLLDAASALEGISLSVALHKRCDTVFNNPPLGSGLN